MNTMIRGGLCGFLAAALVASLATPAFAQAQPQQVFWEHPEPETVSRFVILVSDIEGRAEGAREEDVGKPQGTPNGGGAIFSAIVALDPTDWVAVTAVGPNGQRSTPSNWDSIKPTRPGQPLLVD